ncbi:MAG: hypothetical protein ACM34K_02240 [Bacillota bacterium]
MNRKKKNNIILIVLLVLVIAGGTVYSMFVQRKEMVKKEKHLAELKKSYASKDVLMIQLKDIERQATVIDSLLALNEYNIPGQIPEEKFFDFVNRYSNEDFIYTGISVEFKEKRIENGMNYYVYKIYGNGRFKDIYNLVYAIEHSRELKKIESAEIKANTVVDDNEFPKYLVSINMIVDVYFANNNQLISSVIGENNLAQQQVYNAYYPLIRNEILPNYDDLPDIQKGELISLVPQGAFIKDGEGNTYLMKRGERVYLGFLTDIDYANKKVTFTLNKGGLIEDLVLEMDARKNKGK